MQQVVHVFGVQMVLQLVLVGTQYPEAWGEVELPCTFAHIWMLVLAELWQPDANMPPLSRHLMRENRQGEGSRP